MASRRRRSVAASALAAADEDVLRDVDEDAAAAELRLVGAVAEGVAARRGLASTDECKCVSYVRKRSRADRNEGA